MKDKKIKQKQGRKTEKKSILAKMSPKRMDFKGRGWKSVYTLLVDGIVIIIATILYAISVNAFSAPNNIAPGGATGLSTLFNHLFATPIGLGIIAINLPLFIIGLIKFGFKFMAKTIAATVVLSFGIDLAAPYIQPYMGDTLLAALFGGLLSGAALGFVFSRGATTGGSDLGALLINKKIPHIPMGKLILLVDILVITTATVVYGSFESALYAGVMLFTSSSVIDKALYGSDSGKFMLIISKDNEKIARAILDQVGRGVTILDGQGAYSKDNRPVILCAVRRPEAYRVRSVIKSIDHEAFIVVGDASEIIGEGFKSIHKSGIET